MAKLVVVALFLLSALVVDCEAWYSAPKEYNDMTNINIWQCQKSAGQQWYDVQSVNFQLYCSYVRSLCMDARST